MGKLARRKVILMMALLVTYATAFGLPELVPDGLEGMTGQEYEAAAAGRELAYATLWENQLERLWIRQTRVVSVVSGAELDPGSPGLLAPGWEVRVKAYALFGLPYSQITMAYRSGSVDYRLPSGLIALLLVGALPVYAWVRWPRDGDNQRCRRA